MERNPPTAPSEKWQKRYYRGIDMHEASGVADHKARLRLAPFAPEDAPVTPASPELVLRGDAETIGRVLRVIADGIAAGKDAATLAAGLQELGLDAATSLSVISAAR
jgi:hypothetical protein